MGDERKLALGIHSQAKTDGFTDGHAWITVGYSDQPLSQHTTYGLWPDKNAKNRLQLYKEAKQDQGIKIDYPNTEVRRNLERGDKHVVTPHFTLDNIPNASRYYALTPQQYQTLQNAINKPDTWQYTHTCAEWASEMIETTTRQFISADDTLGFETPHQLIKSIKTLEEKQPSSIENPIPPAQHNKLKTELEQPQTQPLLTTSAQPTLQPHQIANQILQQLTQANTNNTPIQRT